MSLKNKGIMVKSDRKSLFQEPLSIVLAHTEQEQIALTADKDRINSDIYKGKTKVGKKVVFEVRDRLKEIYYNKCAYCEIKEFKPEVEHYRPKKAVAENKNHPGYYWLCYEWSNLLPSCRYCNTEGGKGNQFPVMSDYVFCPPIENEKLIREKCKANYPELLNENPFLINPEIDDPTEYFVFDASGKMTGIDIQGRGEKTIKICNLNRENLLYRRQKIVDDIVVGIRDIFLTYFEVHASVEWLFGSLKMIIQNVKKNSLESMEFSQMSAFCFKNFTTMIIPFFPNQVHRDFLTEVFMRMNE